MSKKILCFNNININFIETGKFLRIGNVYFDYKLNRISKNDTKQIKNVKAILQNPDELQLFSVEEIKQNGNYFLGKYGYKDKNGNIVIAPVFILAYPFKFGFARVATEVFYDQSGRMKYKFNYTNKDGEFLFNDFFSECTDITKYHTAVAWDKNGAPLIVTKERNKIDENKFKYIYPIKSDDFLYDPTEPNYYECRFYKYSYDSVEVDNNKSNKLLGLYDSKNCTIVLPPKYKNFEYYSHNLVYAMAADGNENVIDKHGNQLSRENYTVWDFYGYDVVIDIKNESVSVFNSDDIESLEDYDIIL